MKKISILLATMFFLASCGDKMAKFKPAVEQLSTNWDSATTAVTEFSNMVKNEQSGLLNLANSMTVDPAISQKWNEETKTKFSNITALTQSHANGLSTISSEVDAFVTTWMEKSKEMQALKDGLAVGKVEGDIQEKINSLTAAATDATSKVTGWQEQFGKIKSAIADAGNMFAEFKAANLK